MKCGVKGSKISFKSVALIGVLAAFPVFSVFAQEIRDEFYWFDRLNRASLVMMSEKAILDEKQVGAIASALEKLSEKGKAPGFNRTKTWGKTEPYLIEIAGPVVTRLHTGRSTWDTGAVNERLRQRESVLKVYESLIEARQAMLDFGVKHAKSIIPAYTGGVQAQPTSMGHFMTAYVDVFGRHAEALEAAYKNLNISPLGAGALGTSSYPIDRVRLADLLGFDRPIHNSYDAVLLASVESNMRIIGAVAGVAVTANSLAEDLGNQYYLAKPWLRHPDRMTSGSTIMPQKRNPDGINAIRDGATAVLGSVSSYMFEVHNFETGRFSGGGGGGGRGDQNVAISTAASTLDQISLVFRNFEFFPERALGEVLNDYATATELANALQRYGDIPFGDAHHVAAGIVNYGRDNGLRASEIKFSDFEKVFREVAQHYKMEQTKSGLNEEMFRKVMTPQAMVDSAQGLGGPQSASVKAMLDEGAKSIAQNRAWLESKRAALESSAARLDKAFLAL